MAPSFPSGPSSQSLSWTGNQPAGQIHLALHEMAVRLLPQYSPDEGPLTATKLRQVRRLVGKLRKGPVRLTLVEVDAS